MTSPDRDGEHDAVVSSPFSSSAALETSRQTELNETRSLQSHPCRSKWCKKCNILGTKRGDRSLVQTHRNSTCLLQDERGEAVRDPDHPCNTDHVDADKGDIDGHVRAVGNCVFISLRNAKLQKPSHARQEYHGRSRSCNQRARSCVSVTATIGADSTRGLLDGVAGDAWGYCGRSFQPGMAGRLWPFLVIINLGLPILPTTWQRRQRSSSPSSNQTAEEGTEDYR